jgi:Methyltransferase domain
MIEKLKRRLAKAGVDQRVDARVAPTESMGLTDLQSKADFTLAFAVVHELPDHGKFFAEVAEASKTGARVLISEPIGHVKAATFEAELAAAAKSGFRVVERPQIPRSISALLTKT